MYNYTTVLLTLKGKR